MIVARFRLAVPLSNLGVIVASMGASELRSGFRRSLWTVLVGIPPIAPRRNHYGWPCRSAIIVLRRPKSLSGIPLISVVFLLSLSLSAVTVAASDRPATPAGDIDVPPGGDLQAALDQARPGDTIRLSAGATSTGWFTLPAKGGSEYIVVRTNTPDVDLPPPGTRVNPPQLPPPARVAANA